MGGRCCTAENIALPEKVSAESLNSELRTRMGFLKKVALFKQLKKADLLTLATCAEDSTFSSGDTVVSQADEGEEFYVIRSGMAVMKADGQQATTLKAGNYFGENALVRGGERRSVDIVASMGGLHVLKVTREAFHRCGLHEKVNFPKRAAVGGGGFTGVAIKSPSAKTPEDRKLLAQALKRNVNLKLVEVNENMANAMIDLMWKETVDVGTALITEGDLDANFFYIVQTGKFEVSKLDGEGVQTTVGTVEDGGSFGELALMYFAPRAATVKALEKSTVWVIDRKQFVEIMHTDDSSAAYVEYLHSIDAFSALRDEEKLDVARALYRLELSQNEVIFRQGEVGDKFYILIAGCAEAVLDSGQVLKEYNANENDAFFGERALLDNAPRAATIRVTSECATALYLDKKDFDMLIGPLQEIKLRGKTGTAVVERRMSLVKVVQRGGNILRKDLNKIGLLGCGGFGAVHMVEHEPTQSIYALKMLSKGYVVKAGMTQKVISEKELQLMCDSDFIVKLFETFNSEQRLFFLLEVCLGGELHHTYNKKNLYGNESCAKFYAAGTTFAFEHLHGLNIIYRDLKPENILLCEKGHPKLADLGLAKLCVGKTFTTCGTPDYFAPEVISGKGHTRAVDWWSLGILTYELMAGYAPFAADTPMATYHKVTSGGIEKVKFAARMKNVEPFVKALCKTNPDNRLAMKSGYVNNVKNHRWFADFKWPSAFSMAMVPPYTPDVSNKKDLNNFNASESDLPCTIDYVDPGNSWDEGFATSY